MNKKINTHRFEVSVKTQKDRKHAERAILMAFVYRLPDGCEFNLLRKRPAKRRR